MYNFITYAIGNFFVVKCVTFSNMLEHNSKGCGVTHQPSIVAIMTHSLTLSRNCGEP